MELGSSHLALLPEAINCGELLLSFSAILFRKPLRWLPVSAVNLGQGVGAVTEAFRVPPSQLCMRSHRDPLVFCLAWVR